MSDPEQFIRGIILNLEDTSENFLLLSIFCPNGLHRCLIRKLRKLTSLSSPDLFDEVEITFQSSMNRGLPFVKEYQVIKKELRLPRIGHALMVHVFSSILPAPTVNTC